MPEFSKGTFAGQPCLRIDNLAVCLWVTTDRGPRILGLQVAGGENLFAEVPDLTLDCPGLGPYHLYGGHRLWYAPEDPPVTYLPDELPIQVERLPDGVRLTQPVERTTGLQKEITIRLPGSDATIEVEHKLFYQGTRFVELAPWAITQLKVSGEAILPLDAPPADPYVTLPNKNLVLWPYTDLTRTQIKFGRWLIRLSASINHGAIKIGFPNPSRWMAYVLNGTMFVKFALYEKGADYFDLGSSSEVYLNDRFIELETLGPKVTLRPGQAAHHSETWKIFEGVSLPDDERELIDALRQYGLSLAGGGGTETD